MNKTEALELVNKSGKLRFVDWYKHTFTYSNEKYKVSGNPDYRDNLGSVEDIYELSNLDNFAILCKDTNTYIFTE